MGRQCLIVCYQNQCGSLDSIQAKEKLENMLAVGTVEISGGLVRKQHGWLHHECTGECNALLFATGELGGVMRRRSMRPTLSSRYSARGFAGDIVAKHFHGKHDVFKRGQGGDKMIGLEYEAEFASTENRHLVFTEAVMSVPSISMDPEVGQSSPAIRPSRCFSAAGRPHDGDKLPIRNFEADVANDFNSGGAIANRLSPGFEQRSFGFYTGGELVESLSRQEGCASRVIRGMWLIFIGPTASISRSDIDRS